MSAAEKPRLAGSGLSRLMLGTVQLGLPYGIANQKGKPGEDECRAILDAAERLGVTAFDTASLYGDSEAVLGRYLSWTGRGRQETDTATCAGQEPVYNPGPSQDRHQAVKRQLPFIVSKFKLKQETYVTPADLEQDIRSQLGQSLDRLGLERLPALLLHQPADLGRQGDELAHVMEKLVKEGLIGLAGVSVYRSDDIDLMLDYPVFRAVQIPISILDQRLVRSGHLARLKEQGLLVFARSVFLQGLFFMDPLQLPPGLTEAGASLAELRLLAEREGLGMAQMALSFVRDLPDISSLVIGAETASQVEDNARLMQGPALSADGRKEAESIARLVPEWILDPSRWPR